MPQRRLRAAVLVAWLQPQDISEGQDALGRQVGRVPGTEAWVRTVLLLPPIPLCHLRSRFLEEKARQGGGEMHQLQGGTSAPSSLAGAACGALPLAL